MEPEQGRAANQNTCFYLFTFVLWPYPQQTMQNSVVRFAKWSDLDKTYTYCLSSVPTRPVQCLSRNPGPVSEDEFFLFRVLRIYAFSVLFHNLCFFMPGTILSFLASHLAFILNIFHCLFWKTKRSCWHNHTEAHQFHYLFKWCHCDLNKVC